MSTTAAVAVRLMPAGTRARVAQSVTDGSLVRSRHAHRIRRALVGRGGDPTVAFDLDGTRLRLPLSHELPTYRRRYPAYSENLGVVAGLVAAGGGDTMIDIGANVGDSAAIVKAHAAHLAILCVDADPGYVPFLRENTRHWDDVEIAAPVLLGEQTEDLGGGLRRARGTTRVLTSSTETLHAVSLDDLVTRHPRFAMPALVKSDTDGFEQHVLRGASTLLRRAHPVLFLEYDPKLLAAAGSDGLELLDELRAHGYERIAYYDKFGALVVRCALHESDVLRDLHEYAARNLEAGMDHYDVVAVAAGGTSLLDRLGS